MNFTISQIPERTEKPRQHGLTMVMDKGLGLRETEDFISSSSPYVDIVKLGFGTSFITPNLDKKINLYKEAGIPLYLGGTLLEAFIIRGEFKEYIKVLEKYGTVKFLTLQDVFGY